MLVPVELEVARRMAGHPGWRTVYQDGTARLFARDGVLEPEGRDAPPATLELPRAVPFPGR